MAEWNAKANDVFLRAAEVESPAERQRFLDQHCGDDAALRAQVESLLAASAKVGSFLNKPAAQAEQVRGLLVLQSGEEAELHQRSGLGVVPLQLIQRLVNS